METLYPKKRTAKVLLTRWSLVLRWRRALLYDRINRRVDLMVEEGLFDEARFFYDQGIPLDSQSMKSIGYRQCVQYFRGEWDKKNSCRQDQAGNP